MGRKRSIKGNTWERRNHKENWVPALIEDNTYSLVMWWKGDTWTMSSQHECWTGRQTGKTEKENDECVGLVAWRNKCIKKWLDMHVVEDGWKTWYIKPHGDLCIMKAVRRTHYAVEEIFLDNESTSGYVNTCAPWRRSKFTSSYSRTLESKTWDSSRCCEYGRQEEITELTSLEIQ